MPENMKPIKLPIKNEVRSRAKILTEEAFRETRNYIKTKNREYYEEHEYLNKNSTSSYTNERNLGEMYAKTAELSEVLNKITKENYDSYISHILKFEYNNELLENFKNLIYEKATTERKNREIYLDICLEMFNIFNKKTFPNSPEMNFKQLILKQCKDEFYSQETKIKIPIHLDEEEKDSFIREVKLGNIKLIAEFYNKGIIPFKIIQDCIDFCLNKPSGLNIRVLCELIKKSCFKLYSDEAEILEKLVLELKKLK